MRDRLCCLIVAFCLAGLGPAPARADFTPPRHPCGIHAVPALPQSHGPGGEVEGLENDLPAGVPGSFQRMDTLSFGYYTEVGGDYVAVAGETWTWDHGAAPLEGWRAWDETANAGAWFRQITAGAWNGHGNAVAVPVLNGAGSAWVGFFEDQADSLCWGAGLGYGNRWCQHLVSPTFVYQGTGDIDLSLLYFNDSEVDFDYTRIVLYTPSDTLPLNGVGFTGKIGVQEGPNPPPPAGQLYHRLITAGELGGPGAPRNVTFVFEFDSDGGWSDEDGRYTTDYGPFGVDDIVLAGAVSGGPYSYDFEDGLQGWTAAPCSAIGSFFAVHEFSGYQIAEPCYCKLEGKVVAFHDPSGRHPVGQCEAAQSPYLNKAADAPYPAYNVVLADWDMYGEMPSANGVFYRPGWNYYPFTCPETGRTGWSGRRGVDYWSYTGTQPKCDSYRDMASSWGIPPDCEKIAFVFEVLSSCDAMNIHPCSGVTNFTPLVDNVRVRATWAPAAPGIALNPGAAFQDNFNTGPYLDVMATGNIDINYDLHGNPPPDLPDRLGDSLSVQGSIPTSATKWLSRLWFRVKREGPGQRHIQAYREWLAKVSDGHQIVGAHGDFAFGWMDSVEVGTRIANHKFCSQFHEMDDDFTPPEQGEENEIIPDATFTPGTKIEYFVTANYTCTPDVNFCLPDTSGGLFSEVEILPAYRNGEDGLYRLPCILYVDAAGWRLHQDLVESALNVVLAGAQLGDPIPDPAPWDRYDYAVVGCHSSAPMFRNAGGNSGGDLTEFLGYRVILADAGNAGGWSTFHERDFQGFADWLTTGECFEGSQPRQGWIGYGSGLAWQMDYEAPTFLHDNLGATFNCSAYADPGCPGGETENDPSYCVRVPPAIGATYGPSAELDVYGSGCPAYREYDVLGLSGTGIGNKKYESVLTGYQAPDYAQVANDATAGVSNYRTVLSAFGLADLTLRDPGHEGDPGIGGECAYQSDRVAQAVADELREAFKWVLGIEDPQTIGLCVDPCLNVAGPTSGITVDDGARVNRLYPNRPNPFNPRTTIRFSLAESGPARVVIYDVGGRRIRTVVDGGLAAGMHEVVWDGVDDAGHRVASGMYWSQLQAGSYTSNRKLVVLE